MIYFLLFVGVSANTIVIRGMIYKRQEGDLVQHNLAGSNVQSLTSGSLAIFKHRTILENSLLVTINSILCV